MKRHRSERVAAQKADSDDAQVHEVRDMGEEGRAVSSRIRMKSAAWPIVQSCPGREGCST